ncbi:hypothetical protein IJ843_04530, partial [bacterium]|nr:hypothetical protein [bacterium]
MAEDNKKAGITDSTSKSLNSYTSGGVVYTNTGNVAATATAFHSQYTLSSSSKINNVTLLDSTEAIIKKGSDISSKLTKGNDYYIYGHPSKWVLDKQQQYNNCGVDSSLNVLAIAGEVAVTDQNTVETAFTKEAWDKGYCIDDYVYGVLDEPDGGTYYEDRFNILKDNGISSESYMDYYDISNAWYDNFFEGSSDYQTYMSYANKYDNYVDLYYQAIEDGNYTNALKYYDLAYEAYMDAKGVISKAWKSYMDDTTNDAAPFSVAGIVEAVKQGKGFMACGDAAYLWYSTAAEIEEAHWENAGYLGHVVTVVGVVCDKNDNAVGFYIQDTGVGGNIRFITVNELVNYMTAGGTDYWDFVTQCNVTTEEIRSWADVLNLTGNDKNNVLTGNNSANVINGGAGNDTLIGRGGDDTLIGGSGNDVYVFGNNAGNNLITLDAGEDAIQFKDLDDAEAVFNVNTMEFSAEEGNLIIKYNAIVEDGEITGYASSITVADYFKGNVHKLLTTVIDSIKTYNLEDLLAGKIEIDVDPEASNDIYGTFLGDSIVAGDYDDTIRGEAGNDTIYAMGDNDLIYGGSGSDYLSGGDGDDTIYGDSYDEETPYDGDGTSNDTIIGGKGNDHIYTEAGNNVVIFNNGDNIDTVYIGTGIDVLVFDKTDTTIDEFVLEKYSEDEGSLIIRYGEKDADGALTDAVIIKDYFAQNGKVSVKSIVDANGEIFDLNDVVYKYNLHVINGIDGEDSTLNGTFLAESITGSNKDDIINAGGGDDTIDAGVGNDTVNAGDGNDLVYGGAGNDYIDAGAGDDTVYGGTGADIIYGGSGDDYIDGGDGDDYIDGGDGDDYINGGAGNDSIIAGKGDDIIIGGKGNDYLSSVDGNNTFIFNSGDGIDTIISGKGTDTVIFKDTSFDDLIFQNDNNNNLIIKYGANDKVILEDYFKEDNESSIKNIVDSNGSSYYLKNLLGNVEIETSETKSNDVTGSYLDDTIIGGKLADTLRGAAGNDTIYGKEDNDLIYGDSGDDVLYGDEGNDTIYGGDGHDTIYGGTGNDLINGGAGENVIIFYVGDGNDTVEASTGSDTLVFKDFYFKDLKYCKNGNDLIIKYGTDYEDSVTLKNYFNSKIKTSVSRIEGLYGSDTYTSRTLDFIINNANTVVYIEGEEYSQNQITGTVYNDSIVGGNLENTINGGAGNDTIIGGKHKDYILGGAGNDYIEGGIHYDTIYGGDGDDTIIGGAGNDLLYGEGGENHFYFTPVTVEYNHNEEEYFNHDRVCSGKGTDILHFVGVEYSELQITHSGNDLVIIYGSKGSDGTYNNSVSIVNYFKLNGNVSTKTIYCYDSDTDTDKAYNLSSLLENSFVTTELEQNKVNNFVGSYLADSIIGGDLADTIRGGNGNDTIYGNSGQDLLYGDNGNDVIYGGAGNDTLYGGNGNDKLYGEEQNDVIYGNAGNDSIYGGTGNDRLYGVSGNNTFYFSYGDNNDTVYSGSGTDTLSFTDVDFSDMTFIRYSNHLIIRYGSDSVLLANYFKLNSKSQPIAFSANTIVDKNGNAYNIKTSAIVEIEGNVHAKNKISGTYINDSITGGIYNDTINGGAGNDTIYGGEGNDSLIGGAGNDVIYGGDDNDIIRGGAGNDKIYGGHGNDRLYGDAGNDTFYFDNTAEDLNGSDVVYSGSGYDILDISEVDFSDMKFTRSGNNLIVKYGEHQQVVLYNYLKDKTSSIKEIVTRDNGNVSILTGVTVDIDNSATAKASTINGTIINDSIIGTAYNDIIKGSTGNDTIEGGEGNDRLYGQYGNNTFVFNEGDGRDTVYLGSGADTLKFNGINLSDLNLVRSGNNLVIRYGDGYPDSVTIANYFNKNGLVSVTTLITEDYQNGTSLSAYWNENSVKRHIDVNNSVKAYNGSNYDDEIDASSRTKALQIKGNGGNDSIIGTNYNDTIYGGLGDDTIIGGAGNDKLYGDAGINTFKFVGDDGRDIVYSGNGRDILDFTEAGIASINSDSGLKFTVSGKNLILSYRNGNSVTVANYFKNTSSSVKTVVTGDGEHSILNEAIVNINKSNVNKKQSITGTFLRDSIVGTAYADTIKAGARNDTIIGGKGNDLLYCEAGANEYHFSVGDGVDSFYSGKGTANFVFDDAKFSTLKFYSYSTNSLRIVYGENQADSIIVVNYFKLNGNTSLKTITDSTGMVYTIGISNGVITFTDTNDDVHNVTLYTQGVVSRKNNLTGTSLNDSITGGNLADSLLGGAGNDTLRGGAGNDTLRGGAGNDLIYGDEDDVYAGGNDIVYGDAGNDTIYGFYGHDKLYGGAGNDYLDGGAGNDYLDGGAGNDTLIGGAGNDTIHGGAGTNSITGGIGDDRLYSDTGNTYFYFNHGDGKDYVYFGNLTDTLVFNDASLADDLKFYNESNNLVIRYSDNENDAVVIYNYFKSSQKLKYIVTTDSAEAELLSAVMAREGYFVEMNGVANKKNTLTGTAYNDSIVGGNLQNVINGGNGHDIIYGGNSADTLYGGNGRDTIYGGGGNDLIYGNADNDVLYGGAGADTIYGGANDDTIYGGADNDRLYGEAGTNTFKFIVGDGNDTVYSGSGNDILDFGDLNFENDFEFVKVGNHLVIKYGQSTGYKDSVTIASYFVGTTSVNTIVAKLNGEVQNIDIRDFAVVKIEGAVKSSNKIVGTDIKESIIGGDYADTLNGGGGDDYINGRVGNDYIIGGAGNDILYGGADNDTIYGGSGNDTIIGGLDNDKLYGDSGDNLLIFNDGDGNDTVYSGSGNDTLQFNDSKLSELEFYTDSQNLIIKYGTNRKNSVTVYDYFNDSVHHKSVKEIKYKNDADEFETSNLQDYLNLNYVNITAVYNTVTNGTEFKDSITCDDRGAKVYANGGNDIIIGGAGKDTLYGGAGNDTIIGNGGNDMLYGEAGDDSITALSGNNYIDGGAGNDTITTGSGNDTVYGGSGNDMINVGSGNDYVDGSSGNDTIYGGSGQNTIYGGSGNDVIYGSEDSEYDLLDGGSGDDTIYINAETSDVYGGDGDDTYRNISLSKRTTIYDTSGTDNVEILSEKNNTKLFFNVDLNPEYFGDNSKQSIYFYDVSNAASIINSIQNGSIPETNLLEIDNFFGNGRIETITVNEDDKTYTIYAQDIENIKTRVIDWLKTNGFPSVEYALANGTVLQKAELLALYEIVWIYYGTENADSIQGTSTAEIIYGLGGNDTIDGNGGDDIVFGGDGNDIITVSDGNATVYGGDGSDEITATGTGDKYIQGGNGNDTITANTSGNHIIYGDEYDEETGELSGSGNDS